MSLFSEFKRRNVFKVGITYAVLAWLLIQVIAVILPTFDAPRWTVQTLTLIVILGFPVALILAWAYELTPEGIKRTSQAEAGESITHSTGHKLNFAIIGALLLAVGFLVVDDYVLDDAVESTVPIPSSAPGALPGAAASNAAEVLPNSVAVLPFENLSDDPANAFFATGFHDELLNQLAKIRDLHVIARTSVLRYADGSKTIPEIAAELNVATVMEGTVRYADGNVRLTTQLIDAGTEAHLWSETYTRPFENIFEIETAIAMEIATALEAEFSLAEQQSIASQTGTDTPEALALYVSAIELWQSDVPSPDLLARVETALNRVIAADPSFAKPYAVLADIYAERLFIDIGTPEDWRTRRDEIASRAEEYARTAIRLDPGYGFPHAVLGKIHQQHWRDDAARAAFERAVELAPNDAEALIEYAWFSASSGRVAEAADAAQRAVTLDPNGGDIRGRAATTAAMRGDFDLAVAHNRESVELDPNSGYLHLALGMLLATRGNVVEAVPHVQRAEALLRSVESGWLLGQVVYGYGLAQRPDDARRMFAHFEQLSTARRFGPLSWAHAYLGIGDQAGALEMLNAAATERAPDEASFFRGFFVRNVWGDPVLEQPEFVAVRGRLGFER